MSERKVLNKYYPPDFDPSKIPRARCPRNRQFTVRLMVPCNIKCYTCGEYIAKGKKFNARKEDVENMDYLGVRIYRFYIKCPGCLAEISFRTDPESTDYIIEAGAHRNFQALKLAEEQAAREEREAKEEIESNPMLLLENRTQQSQYEMEVLESLEDLRDMNERHAGVDLGKMTDKYEAERKMTQEQREEAERMEALKALGYDMVEGQMVKRIASDELEDFPSTKKGKFDSELGNNFKSVNSGVKHTKNSMKSKLMGLIKTKSNGDMHKAATDSKSKDNTDSKSPQICSSRTDSKSKDNTDSKSLDISSSRRIPDDDVSSKKQNAVLDTENENKKPIVSPEQSGKTTIKTLSGTETGTTELADPAPGSEKVPCESSDSSSESSQPTLSSKCIASLISSKPKATETSAPKPLSGLSFLGAYSDSSDSDD